MTREQTHFEDLISRYLDGLMDDGERSAFERRLESDESLRRELALQRELDASLKRRFGNAPKIQAPAAPVAPASSSEQSERAAGRPGRWRLWGGLAAAALIALAAFAGWQTGLLRPATPVERLYAMKVSDGWAIDWACENDAEFIEHTTTAFGQPLVAAVSPTARVVGWDYVPESWDGSVGMLVAEGGEPGAVDKILVLIERTSGTVNPAEHGPLHVFSRQVGDLLLYEVTPRAEPVVLPLFSVP